ncbi:MAG: hypothetical protein V1896_02015 [Candidatus Zambryskibacteria bacterium]
MTLTAHAIVGASIASVVPSHPVLGFALGFGSHFLLDTIPHWDYPLRSRKADIKNPMDDDVVLNKNFIFDLFKMGSDAVFGLIVVLFLFGGFSDFHLAWAPLWGVAGALTPDALQFVYMKWRHEPMISLQKFHLWVHSRIRLDDRPALGIPLQIAIIIFFVAISKIFFP